MDFIERFTEGARRALALAQESAKGMGHNYVGSEHLLLGLIREGESAAARALAQLNITEKDVAARRMPWWAMGTIILRIASAIPPVPKRSWS